jgi:hypothetical protein
MVAFTGQQNLRYLSNRPSTTNLALFHKSRILNWIVCLLALWFAGTLFFDAGAFQQSYSYLGFWFAGFCVILGGHSFLSSAAAHN